MCGNLRENMVGVNVYLKHLEAAQELVYGNSSTYTR